jgi:hypothetical protein
VCELALQGGVPPLEFASLRVCARRGSRLLWAAKRLCIAKRCPTGKPPPSRAPKGSVCLALVVGSRQSSVLHFRR